MTTASHSPIAASIRFTSIEPTHQYSDQVRDIANRHGFATEFKTEQTISAPFCGSDYHVQEISLIRHSNSTPSGLEPCINALSNLEQTQFADGFFEIIS